MIGHKHPGMQRDGKFPGIFMQQAGIKRHVLIAGKACLSVISTLNYMLGYTQWRYTL
jgi:hypothetical protein